MVIGVDLDGTLVDYFGFLDDTGVKYFKMNRVFRENPMCDGFNVSREEYNTFWEEYIEKYAKNGKCFRGAKEFLQKLHKNGHSIIIITARGNKNWCGDDVAEAEKTYTLEWLENREIPYDGIIFTENKGDTIKSLKIDMMFEDMPKNIEDINNKYPKASIYAKRNDFNSELAQDNSNLIFFNDWYDLF